MYVLNNVMQIKQVNKSNTQSIHNNIKMLYPVMNFIGSKGGISSRGRKKLNSSCTRTCLERNSDEACSDHTGADAHSEQRPHEQIFIRYRQTFTANNNTKATNKTVSAPELLGSGEVLTKLTHSTYQPGKKNSCVRASGGHDHNWAVNDHNWTFVQTSCFSNLIRLISIKKKKSATWPATSRTGDKNRFTEFWAQTAGPLGWPGPPR